MTALMIQGCSSWAGKSVLTTALCRWFSRQGARVAPFKAQNMSNNARVIDGVNGSPGAEIGVAQWLQAQAAGVRPDVRMNPILIKPESGGSQVIRMGTVDRKLSGLPWRERGEVIWPAIEQSLVELLASFDVVVIEGAGSPAEINLAASDVVNMRVADRADAPVLLVVDIDRGGAFAHLYGTWALLSDSHRQRIRGFVLNRFRGDPDLLPPGPKQLEQLTGVPTVGVIPMLHHDLPDEDGAARHTPRRGGLRPVAIVRYPTASNLDEFVLLDQVAQVRWATQPWHVDGADTIVLPGSKHVSADLIWLRKTGMDTAIQRAANEGVRILGICGGLQLLGTRLDDPDDVDGSGDALGLLPLTTTFVADKQLGHRQLRLPATLSGRWQPLAGREVRGYEIRHGRSVVHDSVDASIEDALVVAQGNVAGWYLHGLLADSEVLQALFDARPDRTIENTYDLLADAVEEHLDTGFLRRLVGWS